MPWGKQILTELDDDGQRLVSWHIREEDILPECLNECFFDRVLKTKVCRAGWLVYGGMVRG